MSWLFRPAILVLAWVALTVGVVALVYRPAPTRGALPRPVPGGDQEVAWLNTTNPVAWERFVAAIRGLKSHPDLGLEIVDDSNAFPRQTTDVAELAVTCKGSPARLWFRWYKLTGQTDAEQWVQALGERRPPPLAIIGGSSSDRARDLAIALKALGQRLPEPPLLLITTATANLVNLETGLCNLMEIYPGRSFRFCYTNLQMAEATADFIRPDSEPVYLVDWKDDPYSEDVCHQFEAVLSGEEFRKRFRRVIPEGLREGDLADPPQHFWRGHLPYSVGGADQPNRWEAQLADGLMDVLIQRPQQQRALLVLPGVPQSARRFLRALVRTAPIEAERFVVAAGDSIDFNTVYRDRRLSWPIQDLPIELVFFCHRNPVDPVAFHPDEAGEAAPELVGRTATSTQDFLLYQDIVKTLVEAAYAGGQLVANADRLRDKLVASQGPDGRLSFDPLGNQLGGAGEYLVSLKPVREGSRILPRAELLVWNRSGAPEARSWEIVRRLSVDYTQASKPEAGRARE